MSTETNPAEAAGAGAAAAPAAEKPARTLAELALGDVRRSVRLRGKETARYVMSIDAHTFAFSVACNAILSFFPFMLLMMTITRRLDHFFWKHFQLQQTLGMTVVVTDLVRDYLPVVDQDTQQFVLRNLGTLARARSGLQVLSVVMLLISSTGIFLPLEVALNRIWGFSKNRSYVMNQVVALGLSMTCGLLALLCVILTAANQRAFQTMLFGYSGLPFQIVAWVFMKVFAVVTVIAVFFLIYWKLPNGKVPARAAFRAAVLIGLLWELAKYVYVLALPLLDFESVYGPFYVSVTLIFWAFCSGMMLLAGAQLSAGKHLPQVNAEERR